MEKPTPLAELIAQAQGLAVHTDHVQHLAEGIDAAGEGADLVVAL